MKNITLSMPEELLAASRAYAREHRTTVNQMVRDLLGRQTARSLKKDNEDLLALADQLALAAKRGSSRTWRREDAYEGRV